jgi:MFS family permease
MAEGLIALALILALIIVFVGVARAILGAWIDHRVKMALLRRLETTPEVGLEPAELGALVDEVTGGDRKPRHSFILTGVILAVIGLACAMVGDHLRVGNFAVGIHIGGILCIFLGIVLALLGLLVRVLNRRRRRATVPHDESSPAPPS